MKNSVYRCCKGYKAVSATFFDFRDEQYLNQLREERLKFAELLNTKDKEQSRKIDEIHKVIISKPTKKAVSSSKEQLKAKCRTEEYSN